MTTELSALLRESLGAAYSLERELSRGGMSRVFVAREISLGRRVVVKVISPDLAGGISIDRFEREIAMAAQLQHPHIVPVLRAGQIDDGLPYYTMPFIEGASLRARLDAGPLGLAEAVSILRDVAKALAYAHERGVVHRDIKPENVLLTSGSAAVTDFGIAKALGSAAYEHPTDLLITLSHLGIPLGSPPYMAPEQISGDPAIDYRADLYSLGVVAYEMLAGRHPFAGLKGYHLMAAHLIETPAPLAALRPDVPPALAALVAHLLQKRAADRPASATEVLERLEAVVAPVADPTPMRAPASVAGRLRRPYVAAVVVLFVAAAGAFVSRVSPTPVVSPTSLRTPAPSASVARQGIRSVAVLPFVNVGGDARDEYFSDGMTDELMATLGRIRGLRVAGRSSAFAFKGKGGGAREIGTRLRVAAVLEGSVRRTGPMLTVTAQLVNVSDGVTLWAETYERRTKDLFKVQDELARAIVGALQVQLDADHDDEPLVQRPTRDLQAYDLYLKGRYVWNQRTATSLAHAAQYFEEAVARDPRFAQAHAGLADTYLLLPRYGSIAPADAWPKARAAAEEALALDSGLAEAHATLAFGKMMYERDGDGAEQGFRRALALNPSYATGHQWYGDYLVGRGDAEEGSRELRRALELDPLSPVIGSELGWSLYVQHRYDEAIEQLRQTLQLNPDFALAHFWLGVSLLGKGREPEAMRELRRGVDLGGRNPEDVATLGYALATAGDRRAANRLLTELQERSRREFIAPSSFAIIYAGLRDNGRAYTWLNRAIDERDTRLVDLLMDPRFDRLRPEPRFARLMMRMGM